MRTLWAVLGILLLSGCASQFVLPKLKTQEWVYVHGENFAPIPDREIVVLHADGADWVTRVYSETFFAHALRGKGFRSAPAVALFPPVREYAEVEIFKTLQRHKVPCVLLMRTLRELQQTMKLQGWFANYFQPDSGPPPWKRKRPVPYGTKMEMTLVDVASKKVLWRGEMNTPNGIFQPVLKESAEKVAISLSKEAPSQPRGQHEENHRYAIVNQ